MTTTSLDQQFEQALAALPKRHIVQHCPDSSIKVHHPEDIEDLKERIYGTQDAADPTPEV